MKTTVSTYLLPKLICFVLLLSIGLGLHAQRAKDRRKGILTADSIRAQHTADSLALLDSLSFEEAHKIRQLTAPVDTSKIAQKVDSTNIQPEKKRWIPVPAKSVWLALAIPGAGQIYNKKYWKLPLIYGGFMGCAYALTWNNNRYAEYSQAYQDIVSNNERNKSYLDFLPPNTDVSTNLSRYQDIFKRRKDFYRRQRDLSIFVMMGVYLLSVIDAYVDAELSDFDISTDLSMNVTPEVFNANNPRLPKAVGLSCSIKF